MKAETRKKEFESMYKRIMDPEEREKAKREAERDARMAEKKADTGL